MPAGDDQTRANLSRLHVTQILQYLEFWHHSKQNDEEEVGLQKLDDLQPAAGLSEL